MKMKDDILTTPSDYDYWQASRGGRLPLETEPMYELPGSQGLQRPATPGGENAVDIYGIRRYIKRAWGGTTNAQPASNIFWQAWGLAGGGEANARLIINEDCQAIQIGTQSEAYAVRVYHQGSSEYIMLTSDAPYIGPIKAPFIVVPAVNSPLLHTMEIVTYKRPPRQLLTTRAPLIYVANLGTGVPFYAPVFGRRNVRFKIMVNGGTTVQYITEDQVDGGFTIPPGYGTGTGIITGTIGQETFTQNILIRDTQNSPGLFPAQRYDIIGVNLTTNSAFVVIQAFD